MNHKYSSNFGYLLGKVEDNKIKLLDDIVLGDGIQYVDKYFEKIDGEYINKIILNNKKVNFAKKGDVINIKPPKGTKYIYKNYSKELNDKIHSELKIIDVYKGINVEFFAKLGEKLKMKFITENNMKKVVYLMKSLKK